MNKKVVIPFVILFFVGLVVAGWNILTIVNVVPGSCYETDQGLDYAHAGGVFGQIITNVNGTNATQPAFFNDTCVGNILHEGTCGNLYGHPGLAAKAILNCSELNTANIVYSCLNGACVQQNTVSLPDLVVVNVSYSTTLPNNSSNSSGPHNYTVFVSAFIKNQGNANSPLTVARFSIVPPGPAWFGLNGTVFPMAPGQTQLVQPNSGFFNVFSGVHDITVVADFTNNVVESNETNNVATITINLP